jgi:hypothetical protein
MLKIKDLKPDKKQENKTDKNCRRQFESVQQTALTLIKAGIDGSHQLLKLNAVLILFLNKI